MRDKCILPVFYMHISLKCYKSISVKLIDYLLMGDDLLTREKKVVIFYLLLTNINISDF